VSPAEFTAIWEQLPRPGTNDELEAREIVESSGVWVARDNADHQHLLVLVDGQQEVPIDETHGLSVSIRRHSIAGRGEAQYVDLVCLDPAMNATFGAVASEIATAVIDRPLSQRTNAVVTAVRSWRWFWGVDPGQMSLTDAVGLFGELWFLHRWAGMTAANVTAWEGSNGSRHDFQWPSTSVEVKTTSRSSGAVLHTVENLQQLDDPASGDLYLYSLRIAPDALAANSVRGLAESALAMLQEDPAVRAEVMAKLAARGYTPVGQGQGVTTYRVVDEALYRVGDGFPRVTSETFPTGLPHGVTGLSYQLDMTACGAWRTDATPGSWTP